MVGHHRGADAGYVAHQLVGQHLSGYLGPGLDVRRIGDAAVRCQAERAPCQLRRHHPGRPRHLDALHGRKAGRGKRQWRRRIGFVTAARHPPPVQRRDADGVELVTRYAHRRGHGDLESLAGRHIVKAESHHVLVPGRRRRQQVLAMDRALDEDAMRLDERQRVRREMSVKDVRDTCLRRDGRGEEHRFVQRRGEIAGGHVHRRRLLRHQSRCATRTDRRPE